MGGSRSTAWGATRMALRIAADMVVTVMPMAMVTTRLRLPGALDLHGPGDVGRAHSRPDG